METEEIRKILKTAIGKKVQITIGGKFFNPHPAAPIAFSKGEILVGKVTEFNRFKDFVEIKSEELGNLWLDAVLSVFDIEEVVLKN